LLGLEINRNAARKAAETLKTQAATSPPSAKNLASGSASAAATSTEAEEVKRIQALIKDSPDLINAPDQKGETLLESAAAKGKFAVVKVLLENGAVVDGLQQPALTALHYAAANGHKAIVDLLLSKGAKADAQSQSGVAPLHLAAWKGYETVAKALLAAGAPVNVQNKGTSGSDSEDLQYHINPGQTPLQLTANAGYSGMVELLLAKGADANAEDGDGRTALSYAVQSRYQAVLQVLLAAHANPNAGRLDLPLAWASYEGNMPALKLLLANGADPNTNSKVNWNVRGVGAPNGSAGPYAPLFLAASRGQADAAKELLRFKADPNVTGPSGTPVVYTALSDAPTLKVLLEGGANPNVRAPESPPRPGYPGGGFGGVVNLGDPGSAPPLLQAVKDRNQAAVELLLAHQADVNGTNSDGWTPLDEAAAYGLKPIAELLLTGGATVNARNKNGETPLHVTVRSNCCWPIGPMPVPRSRTDRRRCIPWSHAETRPSPSFS
jgi:cytohesin